MLYSLKLIMNMNKPPYPARCKECGTELRNYGDTCLNCGSTESVYFMRVNESIGIYDGINGEVLTETIIYNKIYLFILIMVIFASSIISYYLGIMGIPFGWLIGFIGIIIGYYAIIKVIEKEKYDFKTI